MADLADSMEHDSPLAVVRAWQDAANRRDADGVAALSAPEVEIVGPRGSGRGRELLRDWIGRAGVTLRPRRVFARGGAVVVAQHGVWRDLETGEVTGESDVASSFRVEGGRVVRIARFGTLAEALADAGLDESDEVPEGGEAGGSS